MEREKKTLKKVTRGTNPVPRSSKAKDHVRKAANLYEDFTGHDAENADWIEVPDHKAYLKAGIIDAVLYTTIRDGKEEYYIHEFKGSARPDFLVAPDGREIRLLGNGKFQFTDRGIVDD